MKKYPHPKLTVIQKRNPSWMTRKQLKRFIFEEKPIPKTADQHFMRACNKEYQHRYC